MNIGPLATGARAISRTFAVAYVLPEAGPMDQHVFFFISAVVFCGFMAAYLRSIAAEQH